MSTSMPKESKSDPTMVLTPLKHGKACIICRFLKIRCDGEKPICGPCRMHPRDDTCEYADEPELSMTASLEDTLSRLEAQLLGLENHWAPDLIFNPTHQHGDSPQSSSRGRGLFPSISSREYVVESATCAYCVLEGSHNVPAPIILDIGTPNNVPLDSLDNDSESLTALVSDRINRPTIPGGPSVREEEMTTVSRPNGERMDIASLPRYRMALESLTMYGELSAARIPEEFAPVRLRLQREWTFNGGFLVALAAANAAMFGITPNSVFKINSHAYTAVAISSTACGVGIACDVWFLLRYNWVDLDTFIYRSRDIYDSYIFFSLSSRIPTFCMLLSTISLMTFLGLVAYDVWPIGVLVIGVLVVLAMVLQFIVYRMHQFAASALRVWRSGIDVMGDIVLYCQSLARRG